MRSRLHTSEEAANQQLVLMPGGPADDAPKMRKIGLIGDVDEKRSEDIIYGLYALKELGSYIEEVTVKGKTKQIAGCDPIDLIISTNGGSASDMFAIYDVMRDIQTECEIHTFGVGKVMSAGVLLLAAGTKGKRKIGRNCRVMFHGVIAGNSGPMHNMENEMSEIRETQRRYLETLKSETKMSTKQINAYLEKHVDIYLSAQEAVKLGIADIVV